MLDSTANTTIPRSSATWNDGMLATLKQLLGAGKSRKEIGEEMGLTRNTVCGKVHREGLSVLSTRAPGWAGMSAEAKERHQFAQRQRRRAERATAAREATANGTLYKKRRPPTTLKPDVTPMAFLDLSLFELTDQTCHYPRGDGPYAFCGQQTRTIAVCIGSTLTERQSPYCDHHHDLCHQPPLTAEARLQRAA